MTKKTKASRPAPRRDTIRALARNAKASRSGNSTDLYESQDAKDAADLMWKHVLARLTRHLRESDDVSARQAKTSARKRRHQLVELLADLRAKNKRTKTELTKVLKDLRRALQAATDTIPISYTSARPTAQEIRRAASVLLPLVRDERDFLMKAKTTKNETLDAIMNMPRTGGCPPKVVAVARLAASYGLNALDLSRLESVMIVGVSDLSDDLRVPPPVTAVTGLYLSTEPPVFASTEDLRSRRFTAKWTGAYQRAGVAFTKPPP